MAKRHESDFEMEAVEDEVISQRTPLLMKLNLG